MQEMEAPKRPQECVIRIPEYWYEQELGEKWNKPMHVKEWKIDGRGRVTWPLSPWTHN